jgi:hypothetical protein
MKRETVLFWNYSYWLSAADEDDWINFPGRAVLWRDNYDYERFGFGLPSLEKAPLYQQAFEIAVLEQEELEDFSLLLPSSNNLVMMEENDEMTSLIQEMYN